MTEEQNDDFMILKHITIEGADFNGSEKPLAAEWFEKIAIEMFDMKICPEEWVARYAYTVGCSSFDRVSYSNKELQAWIYKIHSLLRDYENIPELRRKYLTIDEIKQIEISKEGCF